MIIDPELRYCPSCNDEYMPRIEICAACKMKLLSGEELLARQEAKKRKFAARGSRITDEEQVVSIRQGPLADMKHAESLLRGEHIPTVLAGDEKSCGKRCGGGCASTFILQVRPEDAQEALEILAEDFRRTTALDHHDISHAGSIFDPLAAVAVCPACGYRFPPSTGACPDCGLQFG